MGISWRRQPPGRVMMALRRGNIARAGASHSTAAGAATSGPYSGNRSLESMLRLDFGLI